MVSVLSTSRTKVQVIRKCHFIYNFVIVSMQTVRSAPLALTAELCETLACT